MFIYSIPQAPSDNFPGLLVFAVDIPSLLDFRSPADTFVCPYSFGIVKNRGPVAMGLYSILHTVWSPGVRPYRYFYQYYSISLLSSIYVFVIHVFS